MMPYITHRNAGFTLIELLVALMVFAILGTITASVIHRTFETERRVAKQAEQLNALQLAIIVLKQDIQRIIARPARDTTKHNRFAFIGEPQYVEFTQSGRTNPGAKQPRSTLMREALVCKGSRLIQRRWDALDDVSNRAPHYDHTLIDGLKACRFAYLTPNHPLSSTWPIRTANLQASKAVLPIAIQFHAIVQDWGSMTLLFAIKGAHDA